MEAGFGTEDVQMRSLQDVILHAYLDPDQIWMEVCSLRPFFAPDVLACCEVAFARLAIVKLMVKRVTDPGSRSRALAVLDSLITREFQSEDDPAKVHFKHPLPQTAADAVEVYYRRISVPRLVAASLVERVEARFSAEEVCENSLRKFAHEVEATLPEFLTRF